MGEKEGGWNKRGRKEEKGSPAQFFHASLRTKKKRGKRRVAEEIVGERGKG